MESNDNTVMCRICKRVAEKGTTDFIKKGEKNLCCACHRIENKRWREKNQGEGQSYMQDYYTRNPIKRLWKNAYNSSRNVAKGHEFNIEESDIAIPTHCPLLGTEITNIRVYGKKCTTNPSLDRIDSSRGYLKGNVQVLSYKANRMKNDATEQELINFAIGVLRMSKPEFLTDIAEQIPINIPSLSNVRQPKKRKRDLVNTPSGIV